MAGKVWFIGAGPGDPELVTVKGARLIARADLVLYAGSLAPREVVAGARPGARVEDSSSLTLEQTHALLLETAQAGGLAARVHTGDPSLYGAVREQTALLDRDGIPWEIVPGVTAAFAAAAAAGASFTAPGGSQSLVITRTGRNTGMPEAQSLRSFAAHGCALALYLAAGDAQHVQDELLAGGLAGSARVVLGHRVGWPGGSVAETTLDRLAAATREAGVTRQAVYLVLPDAAGGEARSRLYHPEHGHIFRPVG
ncbi:MAG: precorrin-4 C(11)-methyltransferase [Thermodesulfobacteriota bacterium]